MKILKVKCLAPTRLDNYLMQQFPALNPGRLNKALRENKIKLNGKKQPLSTRVMAGDEIKLFILDEVLDANKRVEGPAWKNARGPAQVIYDCPQILVVNKPAGLAVDGPEDGTLLSVNGKGGAVVLDAQDVGALPAPVAPQAGALLRVLSIRSDGSLVVDTVTPAALKTLLEAT